MSEIQSNPVVIHAQWRTGSTYIYHAFKRAGTQFFCYYEPIHELVLESMTNKQLLLSFGDADTDALRHPRLENTYLYEMWLTYDAWKAHAKKSIIYENFFDKNDEDFRTFIKAVNIAATARPFIQDCRTSFRIPSVRKAINGTHIYLWRNPWDQFASYGISNYFHTANLVIMNAKRPPLFIERIKSLMNFSQFNGDDIASEFHFYSRLNIEPNQRYLIFYALWLSGLIEGVRHADFCLSIDGLSNKHATTYSADIVSLLNSHGIDGVTFEDCAIPTYAISLAEQKVFQKIESDIHHLLESTGYLAGEITDALALRKQFCENTAIGLQ